MPATMSAKRWTVTINNYTDDDEEQIKSFCTERNCEYAIFGKETGEKGTRHLQGFVHLHRKVRISTVKKNICKTGHYEMARGTDEQNKLYCSKDGDLLLEVGTPAAKPGTNQSFTTAFEVTEKVVAGDSIGKLISENEQYKTAFFKHSRSITDSVDEIKRHHNAENRYNDMRNLNLIFYPWQVELYNMLTNEQPSERLIYWYVDFKGNAGKSTFVDYYRARHRAKKITGGKINDLCYSYDYEPVVFFDFARGKETTYLNGFIEDLKNGFVFSAKYRSFDKTFRIPHVVVFSNKLPEPDSFSLDRLVIRNITRPLRYVPVSSSHVQTQEELPTISKDFPQKKRLCGTSPTASSSCVPTSTVGAVL